MKNKKTQKEKIKLKVNKERQKIEEKQLRTQKGREEKKKYKEECDNLIMYDTEEFEEEWKVAVMAVEGEGKVPVADGKTKNQ